MSEIIDRLARCDTVLPQPSFPKFKLAHIGFTHHGDFSRNRDKTRDGHRYDSVGICNGVIRAGASCVRFPWDPCDLERMRSELSEFDGYIVRINPGQLSYPGVPPGAQKVFDDLMDHFTREGKPVWSSPAVQKTMGAKDALVKIKYLSCGLIDTKCYYDAVEFDIGFRTTAAFQPRVLKRNRGSAGEGVWLVWLVSTPYCAALGDRTLADDDVLELMEMCDNHVERHTVKEVVAFCVRGASSRDAGTWETTHPGGFFTVDGGGKQSVDGDDGNDDREDGVDDKNKPVSVDTDDVSRSASCADDVGAKNKLNADDTNSQTQSQQPACDQPSQQHPPHPRTVHVVDQRLLPRIVEGEVRLLLVRDELFQIIHKKPVAGGMSAVGTLIEQPSFYDPDCLEYASLTRKFIKDDLPRLKDALGLRTEPLPLLWTADFIPMDDDDIDDDSGQKEKNTRWVIGEFNCSCVGVSPFLAAANGGSLSDVTDADHQRGMKLCDLMGEQVVKALESRDFLPPALES